MRARAFLGTLLLMALALCANSLFSQTPQGFNYQAVVRDGNGNPISNHYVSLRLTLLNSSGTPYYSESKVVQTNAQGVFNHVVGSGSLLSGSFASIPWSTGDVLMKVEIDPNGGTDFVQMGDPTKLQSVPYALFAENTKEVVSLPNATDEDPIFVVRNKEGQIVFAVYQTGVRVYVEDSQIKGVRGGFAIGGLTNQSKGQQEYFRITPDSARIYVKENPTTKGVRGGFAIGGLTNQSKQVTSRNLMFIAPDSTRFYVKDSITQKGVRGGFAIGGLTNQSKGNGGKYLDLTQRNYFIGHESGKVNTSGEFNSFLGYQTGIANTKGSSNSLMGYQAGYSNTEGSGNLLLGYQSGYSNTTGNYNSFLGYLSGNKNTSGAENTFLGSFTGSNNVSGGNNTFIGFNAGFSNTTGESNNFIGNNSGYSNSSGNHNVFLGTESGYSNSTGNYNSFIGYHAGRANTIGKYNVMLGYEAGLASDSSYNTFVGYQVGRANTTGTNNVYMGYRAGYSNTSSSNNVSIGYEAGAYANPERGDNVSIGLAAGSSNDSYSCVFLGTGAGQFALDGRAKIMIGPQAGMNANRAAYSVFIGGSAGQNFYYGDENIFIGCGAGVAKRVGSWNIQIGSYAGAQGWDQSNYNESDYNLIIGHRAAQHYGIRNNNIFLGVMAGSEAQNTGSSIYIGAYAGYSGRGTGNVFIGDSAGYSETGSNKLYITNSKLALSSPLIYGEFVNRILNFNANVGIGISTPTNKLQIGPILSGGSATTTLNSISLGSDFGSNTIGTNFKLKIFETSTSSYYYGLGVSSSLMEIVAGTSGSIGFFTNGANERMRINASGNVGIGTTNPSEILQVGLESSGPSYRKAIKLGSGGFGAPSGYQVNSNGDKLILYNNDDFDARIGIGSNSDMWFKASGSTIAIGRFIWYNGSSPTELMRLEGTGNLGIGSTSPDQKLVVYNGSTTGKYTTSGWTHTSDIRLKENISSLSNVLPNVLKLQSVRFNFIQDKSKVIQIGLIAQEVEKLFPELVVTDEKGYKSIAYDQVNALLIEAIKEQQKQILNLQEQNALIKDELEQIKTLLKK